MKILFNLLFFIPVLLQAQRAEINDTLAGEVVELDNSMFKQDSYWRGADGAATVELDGGRVLWLFSDSFIDQDGTGKRSNSRTMIRNSIAIQDSNLLSSKLTYYFGGTNQVPDDYFKLEGDNWFWTGHGIVILDKLVVFLFEETAIDVDIGFEATGWYIAVIDNPNDRPDEWIVNYYKGSNTFGVIVGSSAVLQDEKYLYAYGVKEPSTHETYFLRFDKAKLVKGDFSTMEWWIDNMWLGNINEEPISSSLFISQTEFSVHFDLGLKKYIQIQTYGFGSASIGYRLADQPQGPWSEPVIVFKSALKNKQEFVYSANAHPEFDTEGLIVTYNINNGDFEELIFDEEIYFPQVIQVKF